MKHVAPTAAIVIILAILGIGAAWAFIELGVFDVAATSPHNPVVARLIHHAALRSIASRAEAVQVPDLTQLSSSDRGFRLFHDNCVQCHGAPGVAPADFAKGLEPIAPQLMQVGREWRPAELYWTITHGIKMTGMPAWEYRLSYDDRWAIVAFLQKLPTLSAADYQAMSHQSETPPAADKKPEKLYVGEASRGALALRQHACTACHEIPGLAGTDDAIGPPLTAFGRRRTIAGVLANTPQNLATWLRQPHKVKLGDVMPDMGVSEQSALDMVAYLEHLH